MSGDDERDYAEEAAVRRDIEVEGQAEFAAELAAERALLVDGHMTGPAHYRAAERLLALDPDQLLIQRREDINARALAHATLAVAAAVGTMGSLEPAGSTRDAADDKAWRAVAGEPLLLVADEEGPGDA